MRVLFVFYGDDIAGGGSYSMLYLCEWLNAREGIEMQAVVPRTKKREMSKLLNDCGVKTYDLEVPWSVCPRTGYPNWKRFAKRVVSNAERIVADKKIRRIIESERIDIVHIGGAVIDVGLRPAISLGVPVVWHFREFVERDHDLGYFDKARAFSDYAQAARCIAVSHAVADYYRAALPGTPVDVVYNGMMQQEALDRNAGVSIGAPACGEIWRMAFFGGVVETKGVYELIEGLAVFRNIYAARFRLDIYGRATPSALSRLNALLERYGLVNLVSFKGWAKVDAELVSSYDIVFTCSRAEAFGRVTADAMCNGVLVIGADSGGTSELLGGGVRHPLCQRRRVGARVRHLRCRVRSRGLRRHGVARAAVCGGQLLVRDVCRQCRRHLQAGAS